MDYRDNHQFRFGSSDFATEAEIAAAGMFKQTPESVFLGFYGQRPIYDRHPGGKLLIAGARSGKLTDVLAYNLCAGVCLQSIVVLDLKGELAAISQDQTPDDKYTAYINPANLNGMPQDRCNPVDYLTIDSPSLVSDMKVFCENLIPNSGSPNAEFFEQRAREYLEGCGLTCVERDGVLLLPALKLVIDSIPAENQQWLNFAFEMSESQFPISRRVEEEIATARSDPGGGFRGILGELLKSLACLSDPMLMASVSPPYTFSYSDLTASDRRWQVYLMVPAEFVSAWKPVLKMHFVAGMIYKARAPSAPRQTWILDECAQLGAFPLVERMFSYGAGIGICPWAVLQSREQATRLGKGAANIIMASAATRSFFGVRDYETAKLISDMIGPQTLAYDDHLAQSRASHSADKAIAAILGGEDPIQAGMDYGHHADQASAQAKQQRMLRNPSEILNLPPGKQIIFVDGLAKPILADRKPYFEQRFMAGRYHPNPYHPPCDKVRVKTRFGHDWRNVVRERVPARFADYPQYRDGIWSTIK